MEILVLKIIILLISYIVVENSIFINENNVGFTTKIPSKEIFGLSEMFN